MSQMYTGSKISHQWVSNRVPQRPRIPWKYLRDYGEERGHQHIPVVLCSTHDLNHQTSTKVVLLLSYLWISAPHKISFCKLFPLLEIKSHYSRLNLYPQGYFLWAVGDSFQQQEEGGNAEDHSNNNNKMTETAIYWGFTACQVLCYVFMHYL